MCLALKCNIRAILVMSGGRVLGFSFFFFLLVFCPFLSFLIVFGLMESSGKSFDFHHKSGQEETDV